MMSLSTARCPDIVLGRHDEEAHLAHSVQGMPYAKAAVTPLYLDRDCVADREGAKAGAKPREGKDRHATPQEQEVDTVAPAYILHTLNVQLEYSATAGKVPIQPKSTHT